MARISEDNIHELVFAYARDELSPDDVAEVERYFAKHPEHRHVLHVHAQLKALLADEMERLSAIPTQHLEVPASSKPLSWWKKFWFSGFGLRSEASTNEPRRKSFVVWPYATGTAFAAVVTAYLVVPPMMGSIHDSSLGNSRPDAEVGASARSEGELQRVMADGHPLERPSPPSMGALQRAEPQPTPEPTREVRERASVGRATEQGEQKIASKMVVPSMREGVSDPSGEKLPTVLEGELTKDDIVEALKPTMRLRGMAHSRAVRERESVGRIAGAIKQEEKEVIDWRKARNHYDEEERAAAQENRKRSLRRLSQREGREESHASASMLETQTVLSSADWTPPVFLSSSCRPGPNGYGVAIRVGSLPYVYSSRSGKVLGHPRGRSEGGDMITILHADRSMSTYMAPHLEVFVAEGDLVDGRQLIGSIGGELSMQTELRFEIWVVGGSPVPPELSDMELEVVSSVPSEVLSRLLQNCQSMEK